MSPGAGGQNQSAERPDSAGLLDAGKHPWESEAPDLGEPEAPQGALPGQVGLDSSTPAPAGPPSWSPEESTPVNGTGPGMGMPPVMPPATGNPGRPAEERPESSGRLESGRSPWESDGPDLGEPQVPQGASPGEPVEQVVTEPQADPVPAPEPEAELATEPPENWVPVVRRGDGTQDTSAWDVPGDGLPWLVPFPVAARPEEGERDRPAPDYALRDTRPWEPSADSNWRRAKWAEGDTPVEEEADGPVLCGGGMNFTPEELAAMEEEEERARVEAEQAEADQEEEEKERSAADLLVRDTSAWGDKPAGPPSGVIG
ncbi:hypothetical protein [Saccharopolyspora shandongensis]|uniref:hypothetical protein n=1 Tax=Saccharopolyspora shandongensis TaxID=418495 RepID=UPI0033D687FC